jgi:hypothetical protein
MKFKALVAMVLAVIMVSSVPAETLKTTKKKKVVTPDPAPTQETVIETPARVETPVARVAEVIPETRNFDIRLNPLNFFLVRFGIDFDIKLTNWLTLGPSVSIGSPSLNYGYGFGGTTTYTTFSLGARSNIYLSGNAIASSFYIGPSISFENWATTNNSFNSFLIASTFGYHWVFDSGFNIMLGAGAVVGVGGTSTYNGESNGVSSFVTGVLPTVEFTLGWAF